MWQFPLSGLLFIHKFGRLHRVKNLLKHFSYWELLMQASLECAETHCALKLVAPFIPLIVVFCVCCMLLSLIIFSSMCVSCIMRFSSFGWRHFYKNEEFEAFLLILRSSSSFQVLPTKPRPILWNGRFFYFHAESRWFLWVQ